MGYRSWTVDGPAVALKPSCLSSTKCSLSNDALGERIGDGNRRRIPPAILQSHSNPKHLSRSTSAAVAADEKKPKRKKKNLLEVAQFLPNWGIGYKMAKSCWRDVSYEITEINLYKDGRHGKAWGIRHKAGIQVGKL